MIFDLRNIFASEAKKMETTSPGIRLKPVQENRLWNFRQLMRQMGGTNEIARRLGRKNSYITAIAGPNPTRAIGDKLAHTIESALGIFLPICCFLLAFRE